MPTRILLNGAFRGQRTTGQQRYATELSAALERDARIDVREAALPRRLRASRSGAWLWVQTLALRPRRRTLLSLTSRGPLVAAGHAVAVHDLFVLSHPEWYSRRYALTHRLALLAQIRTARLLLAVSEPVAEQLRTMRWVRAPVVVAPNAPADVFIKEPSRERVMAVLSRRGLRDGRFFLTVATAEPRKNLRTLEEAFAALDDEERAANPLVAVGGRDGIYAEAQENHEILRRLEDVDDEELAVLYHSCTAVLFPSKDEGFGLPAVEALAAGARVVASDIPVLRWVCDRHARYVDPDSPDAWRSAVREEARRTSDDESRTERRDSVKARFAWSTTAALVAAAVAR